MAALSALCLGFLFHGTMGYLWQIWQYPEYSHGILIPFVSAFLVWQRRDELGREPFTGSWSGVAVVFLGLGIYFIGSLASITTVDTYALVIVIGGLCLALLGARAFRIALPALLLLFLMNPIPAFLFNGLSSALQLLSSQIGVAVIRLFGISVYLEGNVIDLGSYKLQVVEACSGLRYLLPLLTLGVVVVSMIRGALWMRILLVVSTVPITVLMNSFRIGIIGVLVDRFGIAQAEGFLHDFEGWIVFMSCFAILLAETWLLMRLTGDRRRFVELFSRDRAVQSEDARWSAPRRVGPQLPIGLLLVLGSLWPAYAIPGRLEVRPERTDLTSFPLAIDRWQGRRDRIEGMYLDLLKLDDYLLADYARPADPPVNLYVAYYASQRTGQAVHSPSSCLPGAGWQMTQFAQRELSDAQIAGHPLNVNRAIIQLGEQRQLVYYWFQQRGRVITNEYLVKAYLLWDSLRRNRSDGALVRVITPLKTGEDVAMADARLSDFTRSAVPLMSRYVPD